MGAGRLAQALAIRFYEVGYPIVGINSRTFSSAKSLADAVQSQVVDDLAADIIFLTVPDDALAEAVSIFAGKKRTGAIVHTSGVHSLDVFGQMPAVGSFHPLYPFRSGTRLNGQEQMLITIEASDDRLAAQLIEIAKALGGIPVRIKAGYKAQYHAAATIASNYLVTLFDISLNLMRDAGIPESVAQMALISLMQGNLDNLKTLLPPTALTGAIARGDAATIQKHLKALSGTPYESIYRELGSYTVKFAPQLSPEVVKTLSEILEG